MNVLMIEVPTVERDGSVPFGLLYAASSVYRNGHNVRILDIAKEDSSYVDIKKYIEDFSPGLIGFGGITASYKNCKELVSNIRIDFKDIPLVVGGVISSVADLLLKSVGVDFVIHGEGEISFPNLIDTIENRKDVHNVKGISFLKEGSICTTDRQPQISNLDDISIPEYALLDMDRYLGPVENWLEPYFKYDNDKYPKILEKLSGKKLFPIITSRGCPYKCIFCYRHLKEWRQHSVEYVVKMMKYLWDKYDVSVFQINDELTTLHKKWILRFCDTLIKQKLGVYFIILSSRVDTVDEEILLRLKEAGCLMINYGYESGSDIILKEIKKEATRKQGLKAGLLTKKAGLKNIPEIIIGFPSETEGTIAETINFLKQLDTWPVSINTPIPFPETPLWQYGVEHNIIKDKEALVLGYKRGLFVNFTKYSDKKVSTFVSKVSYDVRLTWLKNRKMYGLYIKCAMERVLLVYIKLIVPQAIYSVAKKAYHKLFKD